METPRYTEISNTHFCVGGYHENEKWSVYVKYLDVQKLQNLHFWEVYHRNENVEFDVKHLDAQKSQIPISVGGGLYCENQKC